MKSTSRLGLCVLAILLAQAALCSTALASPGPPPTVPEIDPGSAMGALTLLVGGVLTLAERRRPK